MLIIDGGWLYMHINEREASMGRTELERSKDGGQVISEKSSFGGGDSAKVYISSELVSQYYRF